MIQQLIQNHNSNTEDTQRMVKSGLSVHQQSETEKKTFLKNQTAEHS